MNKPSMPPMPHAERLTGSDGVERWYVPYDDAPTIDALRKNRDLGIKYLRENRRPLNGRSLARALGISHYIIYRHLDQGLFDEAGIMRTPGQRREYRISAAAAYHYALHWLSEAEAGVPGPYQEFLDLDIYPDPFTPPGPPGTPYFDRRIGRQLLLPNEGTHILIYDRPSKSWKPYQRLTGARRKRIIDTLAITSKTE